MEPRYIFVYYAASFYKYAWSSEFWIEHTNIGRKCYRNLQKFATPLYLNAASRTAFAVSRRRAFAVRESRSSAGETNGDDSGYGKGAGDGKGDESETGGGAGTCTGVSYG
jgi:hypothetical protein